MCTITGFSIGVIETISAGILAQEAAPDFRGHVWLAYGIVIAFLALFSLWTLLKTRKVEERLEHLRDRFGKAYPETVDEHRG